MNAPTAIPDAEALRACWHPVAFAESIGGDPVALKLLDEPLVAWRDGDGVPHVLSDICIHRGTALSLGRIEGGEIVCPYHAWRYAANGVCTRIPQLADPTRVPAKARVASFACQERYGLLWVALDDARWPLPEVAEFEDPASNVVDAGPYAWKSDASRQLENFTDFGHFPWVHPGLLGDPSRPVVPEHTVETDGHVLRYRIVRPEAPPSDDFPSVRQRGAGGARAPLHVRAASALHHRAPHQLGRRTADGVLLRLPADQRRPLRGLRGDGPKLRP